MSLEQLTFVIPTKNRSRYVERLLRYLEAAGHRARVLVADSSTENAEGTKAAVLRAQAAFPCEYAHFPQPITMYRKCYEALATVKTPLVVLCADDDFIVPAVLERAVERMAADPSISISHGGAMALALDHGPGIDPMRTLRSRSRRHLVAEQNSALERVLHYLRNYASIFYSVSRTKGLTENFKKMSDLKQDYDFGQTMSGCLSLCEGKAVAVEGLYYVVTETAIGTSRGTSDLMVGWRKLMTQPDFSERYAAFKRHILDALERAGENRATSEQALDAAFVDFFLDRVINKRIGEFEKLKRTANHAKESFVRMGQLAQQGLKTLVQEPSQVTLLSSPRTALSKWARALDPMSLEQLREGRESSTINGVISAIESYPG